MSGFIAQEVGSVIPEAMFTFERKENQEGNITFHTGPSEMLKITREGFYVRGKRVPADEKEAEEVYKAFKQFLVWSALTRK